MSVVQDAKDLWEDLSDDKKRWIEALYEHDERPDEVELLAELDGEISRSFEPREVPKALASSQRLTPYGILAVEPESDIVDQLRKAIEEIRSRMVDDPYPREIEASTLADAMSISEKKASLLLYYLGKIGDFAGSPTTGSDLPGHKAVDARPKSFLQFDGDLEGRLEETYLSRESSEGGGLMESQPEVESPFVIRPVFQSRIAEVDDSFCFVLMPFGPDWSKRVYKKIFRPAIEEAGFQCQRADESGGQIVTESIWVDICRAKVIVADLTGKNENVMYEVGIAHTVGKPVVLLSQDEIDPPFDIGHHRVHVYEDTSAGPDELKDQLPGVIEDIVEEHERRNRQELQLSSPPPAYTAGFGMSGGLGRSGVF